MKIPLFKHRVRPSPVNTRGIARTTTLKKLLLVSRGPNISFWMASPGVWLTKKMMVNTMRMQQGCADSHDTEIIHYVKSFFIWFYILHDLSQPLLLFEAKHVEPKLLLGNLWRVAKGAHHLSLMHDKNPVTQ